MVNPSVAIDNNVIDVPNWENPLHATQEHPHHPLERGGARSEPKRQPAVLSLTIGSNEAGLRSIFLHDLYLVKSVTYIHDGEVALSFEGC